MRIDFKSMNHKMQSMYRSLWESKDLEAWGEICRTPSISKGKVVISKNSYSFCGEDKKKVIINNFGIENIDLFNMQFQNAVGGSGQEYEKITTMHSSSLCALLFFYNVTKTNPLELELKTDKGNRHVIFEDVVFEFKSPVIERNYPSNMDVVLLGFDRKTNEKIVFLLESKFSEYYIYASRTSGKISVEYAEKEGINQKFYNKDFLDKLGLTMENDIKKKNKIRLKSVKDVFYIDGIKQMISHFIGSQNLLEGSYYNETDDIKKQKQNKVTELVANNAVVILGESNVRIMV